jgi:hypothetical protein
MSEQTMPAADTRPADLLEREPTRQLVHEAIDQARELVRLEVALARSEIESELSRAKAGAIALSGAAAAAVASLTLFLVAAALAFAHKSWAALSMAAGLLLVVVALGIAGYKLLPKPPIAETTKRIASDLNRLKERIT